jgi:hydroxymethylpyrimidine pyrophosphatase-like HAD family hydrolase
VCQRLSVDASEVLAFGDALNDLEMLQWAGHGVAMGNAIDVVRDAADEVTAANADDGVAAVIERMLRG